MRRCVAGGANVMGFDGSAGASPRSFKLAAGAEHKDGG